MGVDSLKAAVRPSAARLGYFRSDSADRRGNLGQEAWFPEGHVTTMRSLVRRGMLSPWKKDYYSRYQGNVPRRAVKTCRRAHVLACWAGLS